MYPLQQTVTYNSGCLKKNSFGVLVICIRRLITELILFDNLMQICPSFSDMNSRQMASTSQDDTEHIQVRFQ